MQELVQRAVLLNEVKCLILGDAEISIHHIVVGNGDQRLGNAAAHQGAHMIGNHRRRAVHRTLHLGVAQAVAGVEFLGLGLRQGCLGLVQRIERSLNGIVGNHLSGLQFAAALIFHPCRGKFGLGSLHIGTGHLQGSPVGCLVDNEQRLTFSHLLSLVDANAGNRAADLRTYFHNLPTRKTCCIGRHERLVAARHLHGFYNLLPAMFLLLRLFFTGIRQHGKYCQKNPFVESFHIN